MMASTQGSYRNVFFLKPPYSHSYNYSTATMLGWCVTVFLSVRVRRHLFYNFYLCGVHCHLLYSVFICITVRCYLSYSVLILSVLGCAVMDYIFIYVIVHWRGLVR